MGLKTLVSFNVSLVLEERSQRKQIKLKWKIYGLVFLKTQNKKIYTKYGTIFDIDFSLFNTIFSNKILPDYDTNPNQIIYSNLEGKGVTQGATINLNSQFSNGLNIIMGATFIDSKVITNNISKYPYLTEKFSANYKVSYTLFKPKITFDISGTIIGPMKLPLGPSRPRRGISVPDVSR